MNAILRNSLKQISLYTFVTQFISAAQPWQPCCWHPYKFTIMLAGWDSNPRWSCFTGLTARTVRPLRQPANIIYPIKEYTWLFIQCVSQRGTMHTVLPILETRSIIIIILHINTSKTTRVNTRLRLIYLRIYHAMLRGKDSNLRPSGYEPDELPLLLPHYAKRKTASRNWFIKSKLLPSE